MPDAGDGLKTVLLHALERDRWDAFVRRHALGTVYHLSCWRDVLERSFRHIRGQIIAVRENDRIVAGLPVYFVRSLVTGKRMVSAPFALVCSPLVSGDADLAAILGILRGLCASSGSDYLEVRSTVPQPVLSRAGFVESGAYRTHNLKLDKPPEKLMASFHKNAVRSVRRALKSGIELKYGRTEKDLSVFYRMLMDSRTRMGLPPMPYRFFKAMWGVFKPRGQLDLMLALVDGAPAAGKILLKHGDTVYFEYGCDVLEYRRLRVNHFLEWKAIETACVQGFRNYNFGRTSIYNRGLLDYKRRWGTKESTLLKFYYPASFGDRDEVRESSRKYRFARKVFQKAPRRVAWLLGDLLYRHMG